MRVQDPLRPDDPRAPYWHWTDMFVGIDMYGIRPTLEVRGKRQYKSCFGAFISALAYLAIGIFIFYQVMEVVKTTKDGFALQKDMQDALGIMYVEWPTKAMQYEPLSQYFGRKLKN